MSFGEGNLRELVVEQQKRIGELENAYGLLQSFADDYRERWTKRGTYIAKQRERIGELESLVRDLHDNLWVYQPKCAESFNGRMAELGLEGGE